MSTLTIIQPAGLGDIIVCQKIAYEMCKRYDRVCWPIDPQYSYFGDYVEHSPNLFFEPNPDYGDKLDLQGAGHLYKPELGIMQAKYELAGVEMDGWQDYVKLKRNTEREKELFKNVGMPSEPYAVVCDTYATPPRTFKAVVRPATQLNIIVIIKKIEGDNPFDWCGVLEQAAELHLVDSVFCYLAELIPTKAEVMCIYPRSQHTKTILTKGVWKKPWRYMENG